MANDNNYELIHGEAGETLKRWSRGPIDVVVTSPTYWNEKDVARSGALGRESRVQDYALRLARVFAGLRGKLKKSGSLWLVLGDDYRNDVNEVPQTVAKALMDDGWLLQRVYGWDKRANTITRTTGLAAGAYKDYVMQFTQGESYYFTSEPFGDSCGIGGSTHYEGSDTLAFPMQLIRPLIDATCPLGGTVVDPFVGTGTTVMAAVQANRKGIGIDLSKAELDIARRRLGGEFTLMKSRDAVKDVRKASMLVDRGLYLWGLLLKDENAGVENPDAGDEDDFLALPEVPAEDSVPSRQKVFEALGQVAQMLQQVLKDPELARQMNPEEQQRIGAVASWLGRGAGGSPTIGTTGGGYYERMIKKQAEDLNLSVKAVIRNPAGHLVLKDAHSDWWDLPGGHVEDGETLDEALGREVKEETDLDLVKSRMRYVKALRLGDEIRPVVMYDAMAKGRVRLSNEHTGYAWASDKEIGRDSFNLGVFKQFFITDPSVAANRAGQGVNAAPVIEQDGIVQEENADVQVQKQGPPGPPPRPGLVWHQETNRWRREKTGEVVEHDAELTPKHIRGESIHELHDFMAQHGIELLPEDITVRHQAPDKPAVIRAIEAWREKQGTTSKLLKGSFGDPESALGAIRREHPDAEVADRKQDGDVVVECDGDGGEKESWYVTADGMVYEYWHPEEGDVDKGGVMPGSQFEPLSNAKKSGDRVTHDVYKRDENGFIVARMHVEEA